MASNHRAFLLGFSVGSMLFRYIKQWIRNTYFYFTIDSNVECCICYESLKDKHIIVCNQCKKIFDVTCAADWLDTGSTCPCCRNIWLITT